MARATNLSPIHCKIWKSCWMRVAPGDQRTRPIIGCHKVLESNGASASELSLLASTSTWITRIFVLSRQWRTTASWKPWSRSLKNGKFVTLILI